MARNGEIKGMKELDVTKPVQLRNGRRAGIYKVYETGKFPIHGWWEDEDGEIKIGGWCRDGSGTMSTKPSEIDLINIPQKFHQKFWVNIYRYPDGNIAPQFAYTREIADKVADTDRVACIEILLEGTEGDGLEKTNELDTKDNR